MAAHQQIAFPVAGYGAILNLSRTFPDRHHVAELAVVGCLLRVVTLSA
jgi:hypothetical protein